MSELGGRSPWPLRLGWALQACFGGRPTTNDQRPKKTDDGRPKTTEDRRPITGYGGWPNLSHGIPNLGLPHPSRIFCGRVGRHADYNLRECVSNQSATKTSAACISSRL